jgi:hypothetical protein
VVLDMPDGPTVVGPKTLQNAERLFAQAERVRKPLVAWVGGGPTQREQFAEVQQAQAPRFGLVTDDRKSAIEWLTRAG